MQVQLKSLFILFLCLEVGVVHPHSRWVLVVFGACNSLYGVCCRKTECDCVTRSQVELVSQFYQSYGSTNWNG